MNKLDTQKFMWTLVSDDIRQGDKKQRVHYRTAGCCYILLFLLLSYGSATSQTSKGEGLQRDLQTLATDFLLDNTATAYNAFQEAPCAKSVPDDLFLNDVSGEV